MNIILTSDYGCYFLTPANVTLARRMEDLTGEGSVIFQTDLDFPGLAHSLGWKGKIGRERCRHSGTDGTVDCPECGRTAGQYISAATEWLNLHIGHVFRGKGEEYFPELP